MFTDCQLSTSHLPTPSLRSDRILWATVEWVKHVSCRERWKGEGRASTMPGSGSDFVYRSRCWCTISRGTDLGRANIIDRMTWVRCKGILCWNDVLRYQPIIEQIETCEEELWEYLVQRQQCCLRRFRKRLYRHKRCRHPFHSRWLVLNWLDIIENSRQNLSQCRLDHQCMEDKRQLYLHLNM